MLVRGMRLSLMLHPGSACPSVSGIEVEAGRAGPALLALRFRVAGRIADLRLPPARPPERVDGLWRHSCFEAFVRG